MSVKPVQIFDACNNIITVDINPDGMMVCVSIMERDGTKPVITEVILSPDKALQLARAVWDAQLSIDQSY